MYAYFNADVECFKTNRLHGVHGGTILVHNRKWVRELVMYPWLTCALIKECIAPTGSHLKPCDLTAPNNYCCHRYDQAALSIILHQLLNYQQKYITLKMSSQLFTYKRGDKSGKNYIQNFRVNN